MPYPDASTEPELPKNWFLVPQVSQTIEAYPCWTAALPVFIATNHELPVTRTHAIAREFGRCPFTVLPAMMPFEVPSFASIPSAPADVIVLKATTLRSERSGCPAVISAHRRWDVPM